mgnify:CR=1 FL=1
MALELHRGNTPAASRLQSGTPAAITGKADELIALARKNSLWPLTFGLACCAIEMISAYMPHHDIDRLGMVTWPSPRQSDVMIVAGTVVKKMAEPIKLLYDQMPDPKWVIRSNRTLGFLSSKSIAASSVGRFLVTNRFLPRLGRLYIAKCT